MGLLDVFRRGPAKPAKASDDDLFDDDFQRKLEMLALVSRRVFAGRMRAERRTKKTWAAASSSPTTATTSPATTSATSTGASTSASIACWCASSRKRKTSRSTSSSTPRARWRSATAGSFWRYAKKVCAALAYVGLANLDRVSIVSTADRVMERACRRRAARLRIFKVFRFLRELDPAGTPTDLHDALKTFVAQNKKRGLAILVSDLYDPKGFERTASTSFGTTSSIPSSCTSSTRKRPNPS